jgi:hypothetical protein
MPGTDSGPSCRGPTWRVCPACRNRNTCGSRGAIRRPPSRERDAASSVRIARASLPTDMGEEAKSPRGRRALRSPEARGAHGRRRSDDRERSGGGSPRTRASSRAQPLIRRRGSRRRRQCWPRSPFALRGPPGWGCAQRDTGGIGALPERSRLRREQPAGRMHRGGTAERGHGPWTCRHMPMHRVNEPPSHYRRLMCMSGRQTTHFANERQENICPVPRQPFRTAVTTRQRCAARQSVARWAPVLPGDQVEYGMRSSCIVTSSDNFVVDHLCESGSSKSTSLRFATSSHASISGVDTRTTRRVVCVNGARSFGMSHHRLEYVARSSLHRATLKRPIVRSDPNPARIDAWDRTLTTS